MVEFLGEKMDVHLSTARHPQVVAHIDAHRRIAPNDERRMSFDMDRAHFFEPGELGVTLTTAPRSS